MGGRAAVNFDGGRRAGGWIHCPYVLWYPNPYGIHSAFLHEFLGLVFLSPLEFAPTPFEIQAG